MVAKAGHGERERFMFKGHSKELREAVLKKVQTKSKSQMKLKRSKQFVFKRF